MSKKIFKKVIIGGTFDILHKGHEAFLKKAFNLGQVTIGLTSSKMAERIKKRKINSFSKRKRELENFLNKNFSAKAKIIKIEDKFGPTLKEDFDYIVVSPDTYKTALLINQKRKKTEKKQIKIIKIKFILTEDGKPISATKIKKGRINIKGKLVKNKK